MGENPNHSRVFGSYMMEMGPLYGVRDEAGEDGYRSMVDSLVERCDWSTPRAQDNQDQVTGAQTDTSGKMPVPTAGSAYNTNPSPDILYVDYSVD